MAKLTKAQRREIDGALSCLERALRYLESDHIAIARVGRINSVCVHGTEYRAGAHTVTREHFVGREGAEWDIDFVPTLEPVSKGVGSDFVALYDVRRALQRLSGMEG